MEALNKILARLPLIPLTILILGYLAYDYYDWQSSDGSEYGMKKAALTASKGSLDVSKAKLKQVEDFYKNLEVTRSRIISLAEQLNGAKSSLSTEIDVASFVKILTLEAKKLGIVIKGIKPELPTKKESYAEVPFIVSFKGAYVQLLVFLDHISKFQQVIHTSDIIIKPSGNAFTKYVELEGMVKLVAYKYQGDQVDEIAKKFQPAEQQNKGVEQ